MMAKKQIVITKRGAKVRMSEVALRIAEKHFGINMARPVTKETPLELLRLPKKIEIVRAVEEKSVEPLLKVEKEPIVEEIKKPRKKKNAEGTKKS